MDADNFIQAYQQVAISPAALFGQRSGGLPSSSVITCRQHFPPSVSQEAIALSALHLSAPGSEAHTHFLY